MAHTHNYKEKKLIVHSNQHKNFIFIYHVVESFHCNLYYRSMLSNSLEKKEYVIKCVFGSFMNNFSQALQNNLFMVLN